MGRRLNIYKRADRIVNMAFDNIENARAKAEKDNKKFKEIPRLMHHLESLRLAQNSLYMRLLMFDGVNEEMIKDLMYGTYADSTGELRDLAIKVEEIKKEM